MILSLFIIVCAGAIAVEALLFRNEFGRKRHEPPAQLSTWFYRDGDLSSSLAEPVKVTGTISYALSGTAPRQFSKKQLREISNEIESATGYVLSKYGIRNEIPAISEPELNWEE